MQSESLCGVEDRFYDAYKMLQFSLSISNSLFLPLPFLVIFSIFVSHEYERHCNIIDLVSDSAIKI